MTKTTVELTQAELKACLHALMHAENKPDCNAWARAVAKFDAAVADVDADVSTYWLKTECLADCTVREVVAEYHGKILFARNGNYKLQLTSVAAAELNARWAWNLVDAAELSFDAFRNATMGAK
jgi:hypothetical protein